MRLNKYLALCGLGSRRSVEGLIKSGDVQVNGLVTTDLSYRICEGDQLQVHGKPVQPPRRYTYLMMHKPVGAICTQNDPQDRTTIYHYLPSGYGKLRYVGRLDLQSRGLLLMTDDGDLVHRLTHPSFEIPRSYLVWTSRPLSAADRQALIRGVDIGNDEIGKALSIKVEGKKAEITLTEGKNREIRRMMDALEHRVEDLKRVSWGSLRLGQLPPGEYRELTPEETGGLYAMVEMD